MDPLRLIICPELQAEVARVLPSSLPVPLEIVSLRCEEMDDLPAERSRSLRMCGGRTDSALLFAGGEMTDRWGKGRFLVIPPCDVSRLREGRPIDVGEDEDLILLDSGVSDDVGEIAERLRSESGRPVSVVKVGLDHLRLRVSNLLMREALEIMAGELRESRIDSDRIRADHTLLLDLMGSIGQVSDKREAIDRVLDTFEMLFSPRRIGFFPAEWIGGEAICRNWSSAGLPHDIPEGERYLISPSQTGFSVVLESGGERLGTIIIEEVLHPERVRDYLNLALAMAGPCALVVSNALSFQELKESREGLRRLNESLKVTNRIMRHDMRNDLMVISGLLDAYRERGEERFLERAMGKVLRIQEMIEQMKNLDTLLLTNVDLHEYLISDVINHVMAGYEIEYRIQGDAPVRADQAVHVVFDNLVRNSQTHGGASSIDFAVSDEVSTVKVVMRDNGTGIPPDAVSRIFEDGFGFGASKGTGVGLFLVRKTMGRYGGDIRMTGGEGGAEFTLTFRKAAPGTIR